MTRKLIEDLEWFLLWAVAFYATGLGFVFNGRGATAAATLSVMVAVFSLACCWITAVRRRLGA